MKISENVKHVLKEERTKRPAQVLLEMWSLMRNNSIFQHSPKRQLKVKHCNKFLEFLRKLTVSTMLSTGVSTIQMRMMLEVQGENEA